MGTATVPQSEAHVRSAGASGLRTTTYRLPSFRRAPAPKIPGRSWTGFLLIAGGFLAASAGWLWLVQDVPSRTAFVYFADGYPAPFPPLGWIDEDRDRFLALDGLTLQVESAGFGRVLSGTAWDGLEAALSATRPQIERSGVLIVDVRGLGAVDPQGMPALIPPPGDPFDAATWIPLTEFCRRVQAAAPGAKHIVLVLDCLPTRTHWAAGWLYNDFSGAVASWAARSEVIEEFSAFTLLCRGGNGETRWRSRLRHGSVLQQALWDALAGEADDAGNGNHTVELTELIANIRASLPPQDPVQIYQLDPSAGNLVHALASDSRAELKRTLARRLETSSDVSDASLHTAWERCEELFRGQNWQQDLPAAGRLLRAMAWWEENLWSGRAGASESAATTREVMRWISYLSRPSDASILPPGEYPLPELQRYTDLTGGQYETARTLWNELLLAEDRLTLAKQTNALSDHSLFRTTTLQQMASLLAANAPPASWQQPGLIQQTLRQRLRYEELAVPEDIRISRHLVGRLASIRDANLATFDGVQVGSPTQLTLVADAVGHIDQQLASSAAVSDELHRQMILCDRVRLELPFLAEWAAGRDAVATDDADRLVNRVLLPLITALNELDNHLHPETADTSETTSLIIEVERGWQALRSRYESEWMRLLALRDLTPADMDALEGILRAPLLSSADDGESHSPAEQRMMLLRKLAAAPLVGHEVPSDFQPQHPESRMLSHWNAHPALVLVAGSGNEGDSTSDVSKIEDWNFAFRRALRAIEQIESSAGNIHRSPQAARQNLLDSRRGIAFARTSSNIWAVEYRKLAWADLLLWLADGALTEFWGPEPETGQPLMARQIDRLLTVVSGLVSSRQDEVSALQARLHAALAAAEFGIVIDAATVAPVTPHDQLTTTVQVQRTGTGSALPEGSARIGIQPLGEPFPNDAVAQSTTELLAGQSSPVEFPLDPKLVQSAFGDANPPLLAEAWFRGNAYRSSFRIIPTGGRVMEVDVDPFAETTFTVQSRRMRGAAITFILDCSASMQDMIPREGEPGRTQKLTAAISALQGILRELSNQPGTDIGVMLYGHRASHDPRSQKEIVQQRYAAKFHVPAGLQPYEDVETILPPGRFGPAELGQVADHLNCLLPWGETPLYLAVTRAADEFEHLPADTQRHIVVITDGQNYQFNPPPEQRAEFADALAGAQSAGAMVHVIGFAMPAAEKQAAAEEFGRLAALTDGTAHLDVSRASELVEKLRSLVGPASFIWTSPDGQVNQSPVNEPVTWPGQLPARINVRYGEMASDIELEGGEAAQLLGDTSSDSASGLESAAYNESNPQFVPLRGESGTPNLLVGVHRPRRVGRDAVFEFSLRRHDGSFLKRPAGYTVSIQPFDDAGAPIGPQYRYQGNEFVSRMPVPVVRIRAADWPAEAPLASVRVAVLDTQTATRERIALPIRSSNSSAIASHNVPGVQWEVRQTGEYVQCVLRHQANSPGVGKLCVDWSDGPPLKMVRRRLDHDSQIEVHTFVYDQPAGQGADAAIELALPPEASFREMVRPLRVRLSREEGLIAPEAPVPQVLARPPLEG